MTTGERLVEAALMLLDSGGEGAVTLRAVGAASGVSHNAPYKHFESRDALLAAAAARDFAMLTEAFAAIRRTSDEPGAKLRRAFELVIRYSVEHPARYQLLFRDPGIAARRGTLEEAALAAFGEFVAIVRQCQAEGELPDTSNAALAGLLLAAMHGLIALRASGRMHLEKGLGSVDDGLNLLVRLLSARGATTP